MSGPIHKQAEPQYEQPIVAEQESVEEEERRLQEEQRRQQEEQRRLQEEQEEQRRQQEEQARQRPAAPVDAAPAKTQRKRKKEKVAKISRQKAHDIIYSADRLRGHSALLQNCKTDMQLQGAGKAYMELMKAVNVYATMDLDKTSTDDQSDAIIKIRQQLDQFDAGQSSDAEKRAVARYRAFLAQLCDGNLVVPDLATTKKPVVDFSKKDFSSRLDGVPVIPYWKDMSKVPLFAHEPCIADVQQRILGDCYLHSALASLALANPDKIKDCIRDNGDGTVTVRFFKSYVTREELEERDRNVMECTDAQKLSDAELILRILVKDTPDSLQTTLGKKAQTIRTASREKLEAKLLQERFQGKKKEELTEDEWRQLKDEAEQRVYAESVGLLLQGKSDLAHMKGARALAERLSQEPEMQQVIKDMRDAQQSGNANLTAVLEAGMERFDQQIGLIRRLQQSDPQLFQDSHRNNTALSELYVRVKKTIPRVAGADVYGANCLWVQMIEKAYVASGLHTSEPYNSPLLKHRYQEIAGGSNGAFLSRITGETGRETVKPVIGADSALFNKEDAKSLYQNAVLKAQVDKAGISGAVYESMAEGLTSAIKKRFGHTYKANTGLPMEYSKVAITIEDIREAVMDWRKWKSADEIRKLCQQHGVKTENLAEIFSDELEQYFDKLKDYDNPRIERLEHRRFASDGAGKPKYTRAAQHHYKMIRDALQQGKAVSCGTQLFAPQTQQKNGPMVEGLKQAHAYAVVGCEEVDGRRYVTVRNPWGHAERRYTKTTKKDGSVQFEATQVHSGGLHQSKTSGIFNMELNDFVNSMGQVYIN